MRNHCKLFGVLGLCIVSRSFAASSVTLYGTVDDGFQFNSNQGGSRAYALQQGGLGSSKWGVLGTEDLGGGLSTIFNLESGFDLNSGKLGNNGALFGRKAFVGLSGPFGTVTVGKQYDLFYEVLGGYSAPSRFGGGLGAHPGDVDNLWGDFNISNAVKYRSPNLGGFNAGALYGFGNVPGAFSQSRTLNFTLSYQNGPFSGAVGYLDINNPAVTLWNGSAAPVAGAAFANPITSPIFSGYTSAHQLQIMGVGASYVLDDVTISGVYTNTQFKDVVATSTTPKAGNFSFNSFEGNVLWQVCVDVYLGAGYTFTKAEDARYSQVNFGAKYILSKRTLLYFASDWMHASGTDSTGHAAVAASNNIGASSNANQLVTRIGIRHAF